MDRARDGEKLVQALLAAQDCRDSLRARLGGLAAPLHPGLTVMYEAIIDWDIRNANYIMTMLESLSADQIAAVNAEVRL